MLLPKKHTHPNATYVRRPTAKRHGITLIHLHTTPDAINVIFSTLACLLDFVSAETPVQLTP